MGVTGPFSPQVLVGLLGGAAVGGGGYLLVLALRGLPPRPPVRRAAGEERVTRLLRSVSRRGPLAAVVALLVLWGTHWPVAAVATGVLVLSWNRLFGGAAEERQAMQRVEALASWTESLRDTIAGAVGLEQAVPASLRAAAPALRPQLVALVDRLRARMPLPDALQYFADDLDDPSADLVVAALILNSRLRGPGLREVLGALAKASRDEVEMRQRVSAQRSSTRRSVQIVVLFSVGAILALAVFNHSFVAPYDSALGQLMLVVVLSLFAAGFFWLRKLSRVETPSRFLVREAGQDAEAGGTSVGAGAAAGGSAEGRTTG